MILWTARDRANERRRAANQRMKVALAMIGSGLIDRLRAAKEAEADIHARRRGGAEERVKRDRRRKMRVRRGRAAMHPISDSFVRENQAIEKGQT